ncbi:MAG: SseB family protein [Bdellovibrionales bacterium]|nr:SseB family protein [Bdellovibrionales bacterium]
MKRSPKAAHEKLQQLSQSGGSLGDIAATLASFPLMVIPSIRSAVESADQLPGPLGGQDELSPLTRTTMDGERFACVFTTQELAKAYAAEFPNELVSEYRPSSWSGGIYEFLIRSYQGIIVDPSSTHSVTLSRTQAAYVYALLNSDKLLRRDSLHLITRGEQIFLQEANQRTLAYVYETYLAAQAGIEWLMHALNDNTIEIADQERPTIDVLADVVAANADIMLVNAGLPDQHMYYQDDLKRFLASLGRPVNIMPSKEESEDSAQPPELLAKAQKRPRHAPITQSFPTDEAVSNSLSQLRQSIEESKLPPWKFLESLAETPLYVPALPQRSYGLLWPTFWRSKKGGGFTAVCFARKTDMDREFADTGEHNYQFHRLSGLEAMRWIVATPAPFDSISVDLGDGRDWLEFPAWWGLLPMFPLLAEDANELPELDGSPEWNVVRKAADLSGTARPTFKEIASTAARMHSAGEIDDATVGRLAAIIPRYWIGKLITAENLDGTPVKDSSSRIVLFTDQEDAVRFVEQNLGEELRAKTRIFPALSGWENSALHLGEDEESPICINPGANQLVLEKAALESALDMLAELLMPRVPSFIDEKQG